MADNLDLKDAVILIPLYDEKDSTTERIIDGIELMESITIKQAK